MTHRAVFNDLACWHLVEQMGGFSNENLTDEGEKPKDSDGEGPLTKVSVDNFLIKLTGSHTQMHRACNWGCF